MTRIDYHTVETVRLRSYPVSPIERALLLEIAHCCDPETQAITSAGDVHLGAGLTKVAVNEVVQALEAADLITIGHRAIALNRPVIHAHGPVPGVTAGALKYADEAFGSAFVDAYGEPTECPAGVMLHDSSDWEGLPLSDGVGLWIAQGMKPRASLRGEGKPKKAKKASKGEVAAEDCIAALEIPRELDSDRIRERVKEWVRARGASDKRRWQTMTPKNVNNALARVDVYPEPFVYELLETAIERLWLGLDQAATSTYPNWRTRQKTVPTGDDSHKERVDRARADVQSFTEKAQAEKLAMDNITIDARSITITEEEREGLRAEYKACQARHSRYVRRLEEALGILKLAGVR